MVGEAKHSTENIAQIVPHVNKSYDTYINDEEEPKYIDRDDLILYVNATIINDAQVENIDMTLPENLKSMISVFSKTNAEKLPPHRENIDMTIDIPNGKLPRVIPMNRLSDKEKTEAKKQTNELLEKGWIRRCKAQSPANVLFVKKPHSNELRMCMDFRNLYDITTKDKYPVPNIDDLLDKLRGAKYLTRLDIISAYNMIRIAPGHEWKTAFRTPDGCFEWLVMPFGLANSPPTWQAFIDHIFRDQTIDVLKRLKANNLYCKLSKCTFEVEQVDFRGFQIEESGIKISPRRASTITEWPIPQSLQHLQQFLGFTNFYRRFVPQYAKRTSAMTNQLRKELTNKKKFEFNDNALAAFNDIKQCFLSSPMLRQWNPNLPGILETDASGGGIFGILSQIEDGVERPVAFWSRKLKPEEVRYGTPDQELLAVVDALAHFRIYLEGAQLKVKIYGDHYNLRYFNSSLRSNRRQAGYIEKLAAYDFEIYHFLRTKNPADAPSRRPDYMTKVTDEVQWNLNLTDKEISTINAIVDLVFKDLISQELSTDEFAKNIMSNITEKWHIEDDALWYDCNRLYIPETLRIKAKRLIHANPLAGHWGTARIIDLAQRNYFWPNMTQDVKEYVTGCQLCTRNKSKTLKPYGNLNPLPIPEGRGRQFINKFWKQLGDTLGFEQSPTTTVHQQGNGLAERINQSLEAYLRSYVNFEQNNWDEYLDLFEFCWNNSKHSATGMAPFYADQGYLPNFQIKAEEPGEEITTESAIKHSAKLRDIMNKLKYIMETNNNGMGKYYSNQHTNIYFSIGDLVMFKTNHIRTIRSCKKLSEK
ncbi:hypothetical protein K3495_g3086 [Podosphaera aphanis]|nr:hypothetical protein K3495_g3086 [Podosphaera aphanis]